MVSRWSGFSALILLFSFTAPTQGQAPLACVAQAAGTPAIRSQGVTELVCDVIVRCTGGSSTSAGVQVPQVNFQVFTQPAINITNRLLAKSAGGDWPDAVLFIDEPQPSSQNLCGSANAPETSTPGVCSITAPSSTGVGTYDGAFGRPNAYQGRLIGDKSIIWEGIPFDPPGGGPERRIRITNVRVNVSDLGVTGPVAIGLLISTSPSGIGTPISVPITNPNPTVAVALPSLHFSVLNPQSLLQCQDVNRDVIISRQNFTPNFYLRFEELFPTVFRRRKPFDTVTQADMINNDVLGTLYLSESGFYKTLPQNGGNWNLPGSRGSAMAIGLADLATRMTASFSNIPAGVEVWVLTSVNVTGGSTGTSGIASLVNTNVLETAGAWSRLNTTGGSVAATWEVAGSPTFPGGPDANAFEVADIPAVVAYLANQPGFGTASVAGRLAPVSATPVASDTAPVPRFSESPVPAGAFTVTACGVDLAIAKSHSGSFVVGVNGVYTLAVSNVGNGPSTGAITVSDTLPNGLSYVSGTGAGWNCAAAGQAVTCTNPGPLAGGASSSIALTVAVGAAAVPSVTNTAAVSTPGDPNAANNSSSDPTTVVHPPPDLAMAKSHSGNFVVGANGVYTLAVSNVGGPTTGAITVSDTLPNGLSYISGTGAGWNCAAAGQAVTCANPGPLAAGASTNITLTVAVGAAAFPGVTNTAAVSTPGDLVPGNNAATDIAGVTAPLADKVGIFRSGYFWLQDVDGNRQFNAPPDRAFAFGGVAGDMPITGDWNGNGLTKVGVYRPANGLFVLDWDGDGLFTGADKAYNLGVGRVAGDVPVVGDWNGDGRSEVGLFRQGFFWILDTTGDGVFQQGVDQTFAFGGVAGDVAVVGDWDGDGRSNLGLFRQGFFWILDYNGNGTIDNVGVPGGDQAFAFGGIAGDVAVVGDWNANGKDKVGVFRAGFFWVLDANGNTMFDGTGAGQDLAFAFGGIAGDKPVIGKW